jgi:predicted CopG family antitoxin
VELAAYADHLKKNIVEIVRNCQRPLVQSTAKRGQSTAALPNDLSIDEVREGLARDIVVPFRFPTEKAEAKAHHGFLVASQELPVLFGQKEISHAIVPYFYLTRLFGGATTPCARALAELGAALEAYVDVFNSYEFEAEVSDDSFGKLPPEERKKTSSAVLQQFANELKSNGKLDVIRTGKGFEKVMAAAVAAYLQPCETFKVKSITTPFLKHSLLSSELLCSGLTRACPLEFPLSFLEKRGVGVTDASVKLMESLVGGDQKDECVLLFPTSGNNAGIDFALACHERIETRDWRVVKGRRVFVMFQCKDWFWNRSTPQAHGATTEAASPNEEHLRDLMTRKIPWLDAQLKKPQDLSARPGASGSELVVRFINARKSARFTYVLAMMNPVSEEVLKDYKETLRAAKLKHIKGVALMTPDDVRRWLPTAAFALDLVHRRNEMLPPLDALVDASGEPAHRRGARNGHRGGRRPRG